MPPNDDAPELRPPAAAVPVSAEPDPEILLDHIKEISQTVRSDWFALLALLAFVGVIMMAHTDTAFFAAGVATDLPLIGLPVPTLAFFIAAPLLMTALHLHLHLYLVGLWDAIANAPATVGKAPLFDRIHPVMVAQAAVLYRARARGDRSAPPRAFARTMQVVVGSLVWLSTPAVLGWMFWRSMARHEPGLTLWIGACLAAVCIFGLEELLVAHNRLARAPGGGEVIPAPHRSKRGVVWLLVCALAVFVSWETTRGSILTWAQSKGLPFNLIVAADLHEAELTRRPADWRPYAVWLEDFEVDYRRRHGLAAGDPLGAGRAAFRTAALERYGDYIAALDAPDLQRIDLREARMEAAFLPGADLRRARLQGANLRVADLQGADLERAQLAGADLAGALLQGADLYLARLPGADLFQAEMQGAVFYQARLTGAALYQAQMQGARLHEADLQGALLLGADLRDAELHGADCTDADFRAALVHGADLTCRDGTLTEAQLGLTVGDGDTILPDGLHVWSCLDRAALTPQVHAVLATAITTHSEDDYEFSASTSRAMLEGMLFCADGETPRAVGRHPPPPAAG